MGQGVSKSRSRARGNRVPTGIPPVHYDLPPLHFHGVHGDNITLSLDKTKAHRAESFCKGIVFSHRPVMIAERVSLRLSQLSDRWNGVLRVGFTARDPAVMTRPLPKYACPDLTSKPGFWAKALSQQCVREDSVIHYYVSGNGDVHFGINGSDLGVFFTGVDTRTPLWAMIDLYGNCTAIQYVDLRRSVNNVETVSTDSNQNPSPIGLQNRDIQQHVTANYVPQPESLQNPPQESSRTMSNLPLNSQVNRTNPGMVRTLSSISTGGSNVSGLRANAGARFTPLSFHPGAGMHAQIVDNNTACRRPEEFAQGYVFLRSQVRIGERMVLQVLETEPSYIGSLAFGLTNCDPGTIDVRHLPEDSDLLLDRPEYWVVSKDVANSPDVGDELSFQINPDGSVEFSKNGNIPSTFMHVDTSLPLFAFWDIFGNTSKIRLVGSTTEPVQVVNRNQTSTTSLPSQLSQLPQTAAPVQPTDLTNRSLNKSFGSDAEECTVCYEKPVDCALYTCGHMCMCYECALQQWKGRGAGFCPICRGQIRDVIKTYRP